MPRNSDARAEYNRRLGWRINARLRELALSATRPYPTDPPEVG